jgi:hypothetical protein
VLNVVFKSGTNDVHGSAYEFLRNSVLDANEFLRQSPGVELASFKRSQFGGTISGPIKRDKTFFMGSYEGLPREFFRPTVTFSVPTLTSSASGDFASSLPPMASSGSHLRPVQHAREPSRFRIHPRPVPGQRDPGFALRRGRAKRDEATIPQANTQGNPVTNLNNFLLSGRHAA